MKHIKDWNEARRARQVSLENAQRRVQRGAAYLDETHPGWYWCLEPDTLALEDGSCCVLGQLHGEFRLGLVRSALVHMSSAPRANLSPVRFGFLCLQGLSERLQERDYAYLNVAWQEAIQERRAQHGPSPDEAPFPTIAEEPIREAEPLSLPVV